MTEGEFILDLEGWASFHVEPAWVKERAAAIAFHDQAAALLYESMMKARVCLAEYSRREIAENMELGK